MRVLILGGSGFVGGRLCDHLLDLGLNVTIGSTSPQKIDQINNQRQTVLIELRELDRVVAVFQHFDIVVNASGANADMCRNNPIECLNAAKQHAEIMIAAASAANIKKLVNLSSIKVYGGHPHLIDETCKCLGEDPYAIVKRAIEKILMNANSLDLVTINFRLSNSFGVPAQQCFSDTPNLVNDFCKCAVTNKEILLINPTVKRDFIAVSNIVKVIGAFIIHEDKKMKFGVYNLCASKNLSLHEVGCLIQERAFKVLGFRPKLIEGNGVHSMPPEYYSNQKLLNTGVKIDTDWSHEIDGLLCYFARKL